jgi:hypothetical protein
VFVWNGSKAEAQSGYNDDLVISFSIGLWVRDTAIKLRQEGLVRTRMGLDYIGKGSAIKSTIQNQSNDGWSMKVRGEDQDLTWLIK